VAEWERERPVQPRILDEKTGEIVDMLFCYYGRPISKSYVNGFLVPILCRKAGVPAEGISNHRFRATMITMLATAKNPMTTIDLSAWAGHKNLDMIRHYIKPVKLAKAFADADVLGRVTATMKVLIDQEAIMKGDPAAGKPWLYYDLGPGYCSYDFFERCPYRMVCLACDYFIPKDSLRGQLLERKQNVRRMLEEVPLTPEEAEAVEHDTIIVDKLLAKLGDQPTPSGQRPSELRPGCRPLPMARHGA
jgi:hypothetical protein